MLIDRSHVPEVAWIRAFRWAQSGNKYRMEEAAQLGVTVLTAAAEDARKVSVPSPAR